MDHSFVLSQIGHRDTHALQTCLAVYHDVVFRYVTVFRDGGFREYHVLPSDWKGGQEHVEDILSAAFQPPNILATGNCCTLCELYVTLEAENHPLTGKLYIPNTHLICEKLANSL